MPNLPTLKFDELLIILIILIISSFLLVGAILFIILRITKKGLKLQGKNGGLIEIGEKEEDINNIKDTVSSMIYPPHIYLMIEKITSIVTEKNKIKYIYILKKQMDYVNLRLLKLKNILQKEYEKNCSPKDSTIYTNNPQSNNLQCFSLLIELSFENFKDIFRVAFKENNIPDYEILPVEWKQYIDSKIDGIIQLHIDFMNKMINNYLFKIIDSSSIIGLQQTLVNEDIHNQFRVIIDEIFKEAYKLKKDFSERLHHLDDELKFFFSNYLKPIKKTTNNK